MKELAFATLFKNDDPINVLFVLSMPKNATIVTAGFSDSEVQLATLIDPEETEFQDRYFKFIRHGDPPFCADETKFIASVITTHGLYLLFEVINFGSKSTEFQERFGSGTLSATRYASAILNIYKSREQAKSWNNVDPITDDDMNKLFGKGDDKT